MFQFQYNPVPVPIYLNIQTQQRPKRSKLLESKSMTLKLLALQGLISRLARRKRHKMVSKACKWSFLVWNWKVFRDMTKWDRGTTIVAAACAFPKFSQCVYVGALRAKSSKSKQWMMSRNIRKLIALSPASTCDVLKNLGQGLVVKTCEAIQHLCWVMLLHANVRNIWCQCSCRPHITV